MQVARAKTEHVNGLTGYHDIGDFVRSLKKPRAVVILVVAGAAVDKTISNLAEHMEPGAKGLVRKARLPSSIVLGG